MATRGRPAFQPTDEQRKNVEVMVSLGITEENICLLVRDRRDKPICRNSLRKHFKKELETGATKLNAKVGHFMVATILGTRPPNGLTPIKDERVRGRLGELFLKARLGWREIDPNQHEGRKEERPIGMGRKESAVNRQKDHAGGAIEDQGETNIRQKIMDRIEQLWQARETEGSSPCPSGKEPDAT